MIRRLSPARNEDRPISGNVSNDLSSNANRRDVVELAIHFDPAFYSLQLRAAGRDEIPLDFLGDYLHLGWTSGFDPSPHFSVNEYLRCHPDVHAAQIEPLTHYVGFGRSEGRLVHESKRAVGSAPRAMDQSGSRKSRIALVTEELPGFGPSGGIGSAVEELTILARDSGHDVVLIWIPHEDVGIETISRATEAWRDSGIELHVVNVWDFVTNHAPHMRSYATYQAIREYETPFGVIHFPEYGGLGYHSIMAKRHGVHFSACELVVHLHGSTRWAVSLDQEPFSQPNQLIADHLERNSMQYADRVIGVSDFLVQWYRDHGLMDPNYEVAVQRNYIRSPSGLATERGLPQGPRPLVVIAHPVAKKGLKEAIREIALALDQSNTVPSEVHFIGSLGYIDNVPSGLYLAKQAQDWQIPWVLMPSLSRTSVQAHLRALNDPVVLVPSAIENSPYAILEPLLEGLQVISSASGGGRELFSDATPKEVFFAPEVRGSMATAIEFCLDNPHFRPSLRVSQETVAGWWRAALPASPGGGSTSHTVEAGWPSVTVAIIHFERPDKLMQAIASVLQQDYEGRVDIVVVDDGSGSGGEVSQIAQSLSTLAVSLIQQENRYLGAARNTALRHADSDYVLFLDDDDLLMPHAIRSLVTALLRSSADIIGAFPGSFPENLREISAVLHRPISQRLGFVPLGGPLALTPMMNLMGGPVLLTRPETLLKIGGYTEHYGVGYEDFELLVRAVIGGLRFEVFPEPVYWYEDRKESMLTTTSPERGIQRALASLLEPSSAGQPEVRAALEDLASLVAGQAARQVSAVRRSLNVDGSHVDSRLTSLDASLSLEERLQALREYAVDQDLTSLDTAVLMGQALAKRAKRLADLDRGSQGIERGGQVGFHHGLAWDLLLGCFAGDLSDASLLADLESLLLDHVELDRRQVLILSGLDWSRFVSMTWDTYSGLMARLLGGIDRKDDVSEVLARLALAGRVAIQVERLGDAEQILARVQSIEEREYCARYPEMADGIPYYFDSGLEHFLKYGRDEGRVGFEIYSFLLELSGAHDTRHTLTLRSTGF